MSHRPRRTSTPCGLVRASLLLLGLLCLPGCAGTMVTRSHSPIPGTTAGPHSSLGGYPFQAVVVDFQLELEGTNEDSQPIEPVASLAVDLVVDLVLSPIDLVAWAFGCHKRALRSTR